jgi:hypothetical protein
METKDGFTVNIHGDPSVMTKKEIDEAGLTIHRTTEQVGLRIKTEMKRLGLTPFILSERVRVSIGLINAIIRADLRGRNMDSVGEAIERIEAYFILKNSGSAP